MSESETSKKLTKTIKAIDKLLTNLIKNGREAAEALKELKEHDGEKKDNL